MPKRHADTVEMRTGGLPYWFIGFVLCFIIFVVSTLYAGVTLENLMKTSTEGNQDLGVGLVWLGINVLVVPVIFIIFSLFSFFEKRKSSVSEGKYTRITVVMIITGAGLMFSLPYLFPVTHETNIEACALVKYQLLAERCYMRNAIRAKDPTICDRITVSVSLDDEALARMKTSCREIVKRELQHQQ